MRMAEVWRIGAAVILTAFVMSFLIASKTVVPEAMTMMNESGRMFKTSGVAGPNHGGIGGDDGGNSTATNNDDGLHVGSEDADDAIGRVQGDSGNDNDNDDNGDDNGNDNDNGDDNELERAVDGGNDVGDAVVNGSTRPFCDSLNALLMENGTPSNSMFDAMSWWDRLADGDSGTIAEASVGFPGPLSQNGKYRNYIESILPFYTTERMRRSSAKPLDPQAMDRILRIVESGEQLRIFVLGGSVTHGKNSCTAPNVKGGESCPWSKRLECALNHIFDVMIGPKAGHEQNESNATDSQTQQTKKRVRVFNLSTPATNSDAGELTLRYSKAMSEDDPDSPFAEPPHIVLVAYAANDSVQIGFDHAVHMHSIVRAARDLWPCNDVLPAVGLVNDLFLSPPRHTPHSAYVHNGRQYSLAEWHRLWMVDVGAILRPAVVQNARNPRKFEHLVGSQVR